MSKATLALALALAFPSSGCLLAAAGIAESQRNGQVNDPLGEEFESPEGEIGWRSDAKGLSLKNLAWGAEAVGCEPVNAEGGGFTATCGKGMPTLLAKKNGKQLFRMCEAGTPRIDCRSAWEKIGRRIQSYRQSKS
ncbi:MAG: hypothetical protein AAGA56_27720 [Myxococcota bacterium]